MKIFMYIIAASVILCAVKMMVLGLLVLIVLSLIWGAYFRPLETLVIATYCLVGNLFRLYPLPTLAVLGVVVLHAIVTRKRQYPRHEFPSTVSVLVSPVCAPKRNYKPWRLTQAA